MLIFHVSYLILKSILKFTLSLLTEQLHFMRHIKMIQITDFTKKVSCILKASQVMYYNNHVLNINRILFRKYKANS